MRNVVLGSSYHLNGVGPLSSAAPTPEPGGGPHHHHQEFSSRHHLSSTLQSTSSEFAPVHTTPDPLTGTENRLLSTL